MFKYVMYKIGQFLVSRLSSQAAYKLSIILSDLHCFFSFRDRKAVRGNLKAILKSEENLSCLTREVFRNFGRYLVEFFRMEKFVTIDYVKEKIKIQNLNYLDQVLAQGKGGIIITAHIGNWELGGVAMSLMGYPSVAIALPHKERPVNDLFNHQREIKGITVIPANIAIRKCVENLRNNQLVALVVDRDFTMRGELMDFLGKKSLIPKGAALFSLKTGAPLIPVFFIREGDDHFNLIIDEPIYPPSSVDSDARQDDAVIIQLIKRYLPLVEEKIRQYPDQWLMFRQYWLDEGQISRLKETEDAKFSSASQPDLASKVRAGPGKSDS